MKYEKPDMKVYNKSFVRDYKEGVEFMKGHSIGRTIVCTGKGGISVDLSQIEKSFCEKKNT